MDWKRIVAAANLRSLLCTGLTAFSLIASAQKQPADLLLYNATVYTVDARFSVASAMAVKDGKVLETGSSKTLLAKYNAREKLNAKGAFVYPGFNDAHAHFLGYGLGLQTADLVGTESWEAALLVLDSFARAKNLQPGQWLVGRGWDQNDWPTKSFPTREELDKRFPNNPVLLTRVDGHAAIANALALQRAGVTASTRITGGEVEVKAGQVTGVLVDNAVDLVSAKIPGPTMQQMTEALVEAERNCLAMGLTSLADCGVSFRTAQLYDSLHKTGRLRMRVYAMLSDEPLNFMWAQQKGKIKTPRLNVSSFKVYADGALGSRGACLLHPYTDKPDWRGFLLSEPAHFDSVAAVLYRMGWQMNTHAIGDSGNRAILNIYGKYLRGKNDRRWRIEHAQVVNAADFALFGRYSVVPSVQPTHATSDMYWAADRLGPQRVRGAYAFNELRKQNGWLPLGTDFPVEDISPFKTFLAAVFRVDAKGYPAGGFQKENALSRQDAIRGMTIWAAKAAFEETEKGSLEPGKYADFVLLDKNLLAVPQSDVLRTKVLATFVGGEKMYDRAVPQLW